MGLNLFARSSDLRGKTVYVNNTEVVYKRHPNDPNPALFITVIRLIIIVFYFLIF